MKVTYQSATPAPTSSSLKKSFFTDQIRLGHNQAEVYMNLGEAVVILSPVAAKRMTRDLKAAISNYENREGEIKLPPGKDHPPESSVKKAIKSLYKTHKIGSKLLSINTSRRKKLPDN